MASSIRAVDYETDPDATSLIVFIHGWTRSAADWAQARDEIRKSGKVADHLAPQLKSGVLSLRQLGVVAADLLALIDRIVRAHGAYQEIILVGHSCGAVLAREVWVRAQGADEKADVGEPLPWADKVRRIVLLAAVNRGFNPDSPASLKAHVLFWFSDILELFVGSRLMIHGLRRGAAFITGLRLKWLAVMRETRVSESPPIVVQLLGTIDDIVAPGDNIDLATGRNFFYLEVKGADHLSMLDFARDPDRERRAGPFRAALLDSPVELRSKALPLLEVMDLNTDARDDIDLDEPDEPSEQSGLTHPDVGLVVFVIHGIRDYGYWTKKLAARIKTVAREAAAREPDQSKPGKRCRSVTSTYGFFPMGPFLLPARRLRRVEWLMDQYVTARAVYPNAEFHFVGHSNGTYLFAGALRACPAIRFERAVLAGSVVPTAFDWRRHFNSGQLTGLVNYVATNDIVVASVPRFLQWIRLLGLGSGGHDGFRLRNETWSGTAANPYTEVRFVIGAHSAALNERHWKSIANYIVNNEKLPPRSEQDAQARLAHLAWLFAPAAILVLATPFALIFAKLGLPHPASTLTGLLSHIGLPPLTWPSLPYISWPKPTEGLAWLWALVLVAWLWVLNRILTRL